MQGGHIEHRVGWAGHGVGEHTPVAGLVGLGKTPYSYTEFRTAVWLGFLMALGESPSWPRDGREHASCFGNSEFGSSKRQRAGPAPHGAVYSAVARATGMAMSHRATGRETALIRGGACACAVHARCTAACLATGPGAQVKRLPRGTRELYINGGRELASWHA